MNFLPPPDVIKQITDQYVYNGTRQWNREEEMRKAEEQLDPVKVEVGKYQVNLEGYYPRVESGVKNYIIDLIYRINYLKWRLDREEFKSWEYIDGKKAAEEQVKLLKSYCNELLNRIPPELRPPPPF